MMNNVKSISFPIAYIRFLIWSLGNQKLKERWSVELDLSPTYVQLSDSIYKQFHLSNVLKSNRDTCHGGTISYFDRSGTQNGWK